MVEAAPESVIPGVCDPVAIILDGEIENDGKEECNDDPEGKEEVVVEGDSEFN